MAHKASVEVKYDYKRHSDCCQNFEVDSKKFWCFKCSSLWCRYLYKYHNPWLC